MQQHTYEMETLDRIPMFYSYLVTSGGQSSNQYSDVAHFFNTSVN